MSLAEETIPTGCATTERSHRPSEEIYLVTGGRGRLIIDGEERTIREGDCALIAPRSRHKVCSTWVPDPAHSVRMVAGALRRDACLV